MSDKYQRFKICISVVVALALLGVNIELAILIAKPTQNSPPLESVSKGPTQNTLSLITTQLIKPPTSTKPPTLPPPSNGLVHNLVGHGSELASLAWLGGDLLASGDDDKNVYLWNVVSGERKSILNGHSETVSCLLSMPKHNLLVSGSYDNTINVWDVNLGTLKYSFNSSKNGHSKEIFALAAINDDLFASGSFDNTIKVWDVKTGELKFTFDSSKGGHSNYVLSLTGIDNRSLLASGSLDKSIKIWNCSSGELIYTLDETRGGHTSRVSKLVNLGNGLFASGSDDSSVKIWNVQDGSLKYEFSNGHQTPIISLTRVGTTDLVASGTGISFGPAFGEIKIWNFMTGQLVFTFNSTNGCHTKQVDTIESLSNYLLVSGSHDNTIKVWDMRSGSLRETFDRFNGGHRGPVTSLSRVGGVGLFASGGDDFLVKVWRFV